MPTDMISSQEVFEALHRLGAGEFLHLNSSLEEHLRGTEALLQSWSASTHVCQAGLFHAAYGTAGFASAMVSTDLRNQIQDLIGRSAEALVYLYCACDRDKFYPTIGTQAQYQLPNRFNGELITIEPTTLRDLCELTAANELAIAASNTQFRERYGAALLELFVRMGKNLSEAAQLDCKHILASGQPHPK